MTAIEPPTPDRQLPVSPGLVLKSFSPFKPASCYSQCNWCNTMNLFFPCTFLTLSCQQLFRSYKNIDQGCSASRGTRSHLVFVWTSQYLGEQGSSFLSETRFCILESAGQQGRDWKTACHFLSSLYFGPPWSQHVCACTLARSVCSSRPWLHCKIQFICSKQWLKHCL